MMKVTMFALAAVLTAAAVPALADEWTYHGGPKSPDSLTWYGQGGPYYGGGYGYYGYGPYTAYDYAGPGYYGGWYGTPYRYGCGPAVVDCYNRSRQLQGTR